MVLGYGLVLVVEEGRRKEWADGHGKREGGGMVGEDGDG